LEYKQLIREYHDNLGVDNAKSNDLRIARNDFINTLKVMYGKTKFPKKTYIEEFNETLDLTEDFEDTTLIDDFSWEGTGTSGIAGGNLILEIGAGTITYLRSGDISEIQLNGIIVGDIADSVVLTITNDLDEVLFTETVDPLVNGDYTFSPGLTNQGNMTILFTFSIVGGALNVGEAVFTVAKQYLTLPTDLIIPLRVVFTSADNREYASTEIQLSEYVAWTPFRFTNPDGNVVTITDPRERYVTRENFLYDRTVGYLFLAEPSGVILWWKPAIKGKVTLVYSTLPTLNIEEGKFSNALEAFSDCLVAGATYRGFRRKLNDTAVQQSEAALSAIAISMRDYKAEFRQRQADWIEFTKSRATTVIVEPFDFLSDSEMLRL